MSVEGLSQEQYKVRESVAQVEDAVNRFRALLAAAPETEGLLYQDRQPGFPEERHMAEKDLVAESCQQEAEASADKGERKAERANRMLEQMVRLERNLQGLYYDAKLDSDFETLAAVILERHPFVGENDVPRSYGGTE